MGLRAMKALFKVIITLFMINIGALVFSGSIWDGSVSTARYGYLPQTGMYAASNAFPQNSKVTVTNPETGKTVDVIILERLEDNNLFLVLSAEAAESIGIGYGEIFYGNISEQDMLLRRMVLNGLFKMEIQRYWMLEKMEHGMIAMLVIALFFFMKIL